MNKSILSLITAASASFLLVACGDSAPNDTSVENEVGKQVWNQNCAVCHRQGLGGAPPIGNKKMWQDRIAQGLPVLFEHAKNGYSGQTGEMPPKGGNPDLTDAEIESAVQYMVGLSQ